MEIEDTDLSGVLVLTPRRFGDARGWFVECWSAQRMAEAGLDIAFVQDNHSFSAAKNTLRGLHYQSPPYAQAKLVRCTAGAIWDVAVDARVGSPTFGKSVGTTLSAECGRQLLIPKGFLHGFLTLTENAEVQYKCDAPYAPQADGAVLWNSPTLDIAWPLNGVPQLSEKDAQATDFSSWESPFAGDAS